MNGVSVFQKQCEGKYGIKCGVCANDAGIYHADLRKSCEMNSCGNYGKCHTCPPLVGSAEDCIAKAMSYPCMVVFQKVYTLEDSFDFEGMARGQTDFKTVTAGLAEDARAAFGSGAFVLGAGGCTACPECAAKEGKPCRFPEKAIPSLESYCIQVSQLAPLAGIKYINGRNTVTYFGAVFLDKLPVYPIQ